MWLLTQVLVLIFFCTIGIELVKPANIYICMYNFTCSLLILGRVIAFNYLLSETPQSGDSTSDGSSGDLSIAVIGGVIGGVVVAVVIIILLVVMIVCMRRLRSKQTGIMN